MRIEKWQCGTTRSRLARRAVLCALFATATAHAELDYGLSVGIGHSDNVARTQADEIDETIAVAGVDVSWHERSRRIEADVALDLSYFEYLDDTFDSELLGTANGAVVVAVVPDRFSWLFQDSFSQAQADPLQPSTPETREYLNYFTTGPDFTLRFGNATFARLFGRYSLVSYEESPLDAERTSGGITLGRDLSGRGELGLNAITERVDFDAATLQDFDRKSAYLSYETEGSRTEIRAQLGYTWLERGERESSGALVGLGLSRQVSESSTLSLELASRFTDASDSMRAGADRVGGGTDVTATDDPFENRSVSVHWRFARNRTAIDLGAGWNEDSYEEQTNLDRTRWVYEANFTRQLTPAVAFGINGTYSDEEFETSNFGAEELMVGASLSWRLGRTVILSFTYDRIDRSTSLNTGEFDENRAFIRLSYRPRGGSAPALP